MIRLKDAGEPVSEEALQSLEKRLGAILPEPYRLFLSRHDGGLPTPDGVVIEGAPWVDTDIQIFFGVQRELEVSCLRWNKEVFADRIPEHLLPIACDSGNNLFCISLSGEDAGRVSYIDLVANPPVHYPLADDFDRFLDQIIE